MFEAIYRVVALRVLTLVAFIPVAVFWFGAKAMGLPEWFGLVALVAVLGIAFVTRTGSSSPGGPPRAAAPVQTGPRPAVVVPPTRSTLRSAVVGDLGALTAPRFFTLMTPADGSVYTLYRVDAERVWCMDPLTGEFRPGSSRMLEEFDKFHVQGRIKEVDADSAVLVRLDVIDAYHQRNGIAPASQSRAGGHTERSTTQQPLAPERCQLCRELPRKNAVPVGPCWNCGQRQPEGRVRMAAPEPQGFGVLVAVRRDGIIPAVRPGLGHRKPGLRDQVVSGLCRARSRRR